MNAAVRVFTLGADPEFFIEHNGKPKAICGHMGGTKDNPKLIDDNNQFKIQEDNVAAEYNIPPSYTREQFIEHILWPQSYITHLLKTKNFTINKAAALQFPAEELTSPQAQEFGCDPDYDAWKLDMNQKPQCNDPSLRTCGGHIHFGMTDADPMEIVKAIRFMDKYLGVWSVIRDEDTLRKQLYGKAGAFRLQPHGGEYRVLSNFWIFTPELIGEVWDRSQEALLSALSEEISDKEGQQIQHIINTSDKHAATEYLRTARLF